MNPIIKRFFKDAMFDFTVNTAYFLLKDNSRSKKVIPVTKKKSSPRKKPIKAKEE